MANREIDPRLQELFDTKQNVYSISKINTIAQCLYQAYKTYILHQRGKDNVYGIMGSRVHDTLEKILNGETTEKDLLHALQSELEDMSMLGIDFPKDFKGGTSIRDGWVEDMTHFCNSFVKPSGKFTTEELILLQLGENRWLQGYVDLIKHNKDGSISIYDWKTSSQFTKETLLEHGRQLVLYSLAKEKEGFKVKEVAWIMLKYVEVKFMGKPRSNSKNETEIVKVLNRRKLITELKGYIENDLSKLGYSEIDIDIMLSNAIKDNNIKLLPKEIQDKYSVKPYVRKYEITEELKQETLDYINKTADLFESLGKDESKWIGLEVDKKNSFFCNCLCSHGHDCPYVKKYNDLLELNKADDEDLF